MNRITAMDSDYPQLLLNIPDPPPVLFYLGDLSLAAQRCVAIVGSRKVSPYGSWAASSLAQKLADHQVVVVSGMAAGVDTCAHKGSLLAKGKTIAVLGCGLDLCYPASNRGLKEQIAAQGLLLSEFPPGTPPLSFHFPRRNRIISGLAESTVIIEAGLSSGSLITAECAVEQGRNIYAVPGNINSAQSLGSNKLIRDGAIPLVVLDDLICDLGLKKEEAGKEELALLGREELMLYLAVREHGEITGDLLCRKLNQSPSQINALVTVLEIKGFLQTEQGKIFIAK